MKIVHWILLALSLCKILLMLMLPQCSKKKKKRMPHSTRAGHMHADTLVRHTHLRRIRGEVWARGRPGCARAPWMRMISTWDSNIYIGDWEDNKIMWDQHINDPSTSAEAAALAQHWQPNDDKQFSFSSIFFSSVIFSFSLSISFLLSFFGRSFFCAKMKATLGVCRRFFFVVLLRK